MQTNPYEPSREPLPLKSSPRTSLIRIGGVLVALGVVVFIGSWIAFYQLFDGQPQFGIQLSVLAALALIPIGAIVASVGIVLWFIKRLKL